MLVVVEPQESWNSSELVHHESTPINACILVISGIHFPIFIGTTNQPTQ
jgi:hypothetical protein